MNERSTTQHSSTERSDREPAETRDWAETSDWTETHDWLAELASDLDLATRVSTRLRPDGLIEVVVTGVVLGYVDHVAPVFVALAGDRPQVAIEVAQCRSLRAAVDALRAPRP